MPSIEANTSAWNNRDWQELEDRWSAPFGSALALWSAILFPRIQAHLPTPHILEIAPGSGRWTHLLRQHCERLSAVDLSEQCVGLCKERFKDDDAISIYQNDGRSLDMIEDGSIDFVFSFDSLVHADIEVLSGYFMQLKKKLSPRGVGFFHHSNLKSVEDSPEAPIEPGDPLNHFRDPGVGSEGVAAACADAGLDCLVQELIPWGQRPVSLDCLTTFAQSSSGAATPSLKRFKNDEFTAAEMRAARRINEAYLESH